MKNVEYSSNALTIIIPTSCPQATHELLMQGITTSLKQNVSSERNEHDEAGLVALASFLQRIIPTERMLTKN